MTRKKIKMKTVLVIIITFVLLAISLFPYYYMVLQSLVPWNQVDQTLFSPAISLRSYKYLLGTGGASNSFMWIRALANSFIVSLPTALLSVVVGLFIGYAMTKLKVKGKGFIYNTLLFQMFFPTIILLVPRFMLMKSLANNFAGMIFPMAVSIWAVFMYINFFKTLPDAVFEAARMDGASDLKIISEIAFPVTKSVSTIVFLSIFMGRWTELMWDMLISPSIQMQTLNVLISTQFKPMGNFPGPMYAASVILTTPIIILFLLFSKYFKDGISFMLK